MSGWLRRLRLVGWLAFGGLLVGSEDFRARVGPPAASHLQGLEAARAACEGTTGSRRLAARLALLDGLTGALADLQQAPAELLAERGQLLSSLGCDVEALGDFEQRLAVTPGGNQLREALLDAAQAARRCDRHERASVLYAGFLEQADPGSAGFGDSERELREQVRLWLARSLAKSGRMKQARRRLIALAREATSWSLGIQAYDRLARDAIEQADLTAAAGWLSAARARWHARACALTPEGERIRGALARMSATAELRLAVSSRELQRAFGE